MGSGKTAAARILSYFMPVLDLDEVNRQLTAPGADGSRLLSSLDWVPFLPSGELDRKEMAARMFQDRARLHQVEEILHPLLWQEMEKWTRGKDLCVVEVPLLFETGSQDRFDSIWCVVCSRQTAVRRLCEYRGFTPEEAEARLACQYPAGKKAAASDVVLRNDGDLKQLEDQIRLALAEMEDDNE